MSRSVSGPLDTKTGTRKKLRFEGWHLWPPLKSDQETPLTMARLYFLGRVTVLAKGTLRALRLEQLKAERLEASIDEQDAAALNLWAEGRDLPEWMLAYARETLRLWRTWPAGRGRAWSPNSADVQGALVPERGRRPKRATVLRIPAKHFDWLVRHRVKRESLGSIARSEGVTHYAVSTAIRTLDEKLARRQNTT